MAMRVFRRRFDGLRYLTGAPSAADHNALLAMLRGEAEYVGTTGYRFASDALRTPGNVASVGANIYRIDVVEFWSPQWESNHFRIALPMHYTKVDGSIPSEFAAPNIVNFEGVTLQAFLSGAWVTVAATLGGAASFSIDPASNSVGVLLDDVVFGSAVPAGTHMMLRIASNVASGGQMISGKVPSQATGRLEWSVAGTGSQAAKLTETTKPTGTDGRIGGSSYHAAFIVAKPTAAGGLDRPVFWVTGDSIGYGQSSLQAFKVDPRLAMGFIGLALDDNATSRRMSMFNMCVAGTSPSEWTSRSALSRKLDLIRLVPNRPYTHMICQHGNNGGYLSDYRRVMGACFDLMLAESRAWGDLAAPLWQTRPFARATSTDWYITSANQAALTGFSLTDPKWTGFDADLVAGRFAQLAGTIDVNRDFAQDQGANRDRVATIAAQATINTAYNNSTTLVTDEALEPGELIVLNPASSSGAAYVRSRTGTGPYSHVITPAVNISLAVGAKVSRTLMGDRNGPHPSTAGHARLAQPMIEWKNAQFG